MNDLIESFKSYASEKLSNPLIPAFLVSWLIFNYPITLNLLTDTSAADKIEFIKNYLHTDDGFFYQSLTYPLLAALFYVFAYPGITGEIIVYLNWIKKLSTNRRLKHERNTLLTPDQVSKLKAQYRAETRSLEEEIERLQSKLNAAKSEQADLNLHLTDLGKKISTLESNNDSLEKDINSKNNDIRELIETNKTLNLTLNAMHETCEQAEAQIKTLKTQVIEKELEIDKLKKSLKEKNRETASKTNQLSKRFKSAQLSREIPGGISSSRLHLPQNKED
ncbi:hypothetical protein [Pseudomonas jilinensis]|uniref:Uncharacterized protein n=1 Tax=Pseudomonas jilinensis TaxID=2078689 RepID=A0A396RYJ4_9PSED|nr:hypothetical protein [Pseudomonas jilinensis]RHW21708.1 hypothetical protein C2846_07085 [Pseudomonas jilinensis]